MGISFCNLASSILTICCSFFHRNDSPLLVPLRATLGKPWVAIRSF
ncbi:unnamed protein product [Ixodes pacificus]